MYKKSVNFHHSQKRHGAHRHNKNAVRSALKISQRSHVTGTDTIEFLSFSSDYLSNAHLEDPRITLIIQTLKRSRIKCITKHKNGMIRPILHRPKSQEFIRIASSLCDSTI